nr:hypothetical protein [Tanacetum cinerariifolium]
MMVYLKNMVDFKIDFFRGMSYDDIRPIFEKYFNSNVTFLEKSEKELKEEASKALKRKSKSFEQQAVKKQKLDEEVNNKFRGALLGLNNVLISCMLMLFSFGVDDVEDFKEYTQRDYQCWLKTYCCWYKLKLLDNAANSRLRLLEESAAADEKMKK